MISSHIAEMLSLQTSAVYTWLVSSTCSSLCSRPSIEIQWNKEFLLFWTRSGALTSATHFYQEEVKACGEEGCPSIKPHTVWLCFSRSWGPANLISLLPLVFFPNSNLYFLLSALQFFHAYSKPGSEGMSVRGITAHMEDVHRAFTLLSRSCHFNMLFICLHVKLPLLLGYVGFA